MTVPSDTDQVLSAVRLGWYVAEVRGRNRPNGPPGTGTKMPDHLDHALPLRTERSPTELRIEAQQVLAALARKLQVDQQPDGASYTTQIDDQAKTLAHVSPMKVIDKLNEARNLLRAPPAVVAGQDPAVGPAERARRAVVALQGGIAAGQAIAAAQQTLANQAQTAAGAAGLSPADKAAADAIAAIQQAAATAIQNTVGLLTQAVGAVQDAITANPETAAEQAAPGVEAVAAAIAEVAQQRWTDLANLLWKLDAHIQDQLTSVSDTQACGYQLGRGLAETYWALDPGHAGGSSRTWGFLLGSDRCKELARLNGRLSAYMNLYTAPAVAGSLEVWKEVGTTPAWRGQSGTDADLYRQIRRWYELIVLGQEPSTLIKPYDLLRNYKTVIRAIRLFWLQLVSAAVGVAFLATLAVALSNGTSTAVVKSISGVLAAAGISLAGVTGKLKNSTQALLTRLRQDAYTDLIAVAVTTAPPPPTGSKVKVHDLIRRRELTTVTQA